MRRYFTETPRHVQSESVDFAFWFSLTFLALVGRTGAIERSSEGSRPLTCFTTKACEFADIFDNDSAKCSD